MSVRIEHTADIISKVAEDQASMHTQLNTIHTNIATMNTANTLLSDTLRNKINALTTHVANLAALISKNFGDKCDPMIGQGIQQMQITHIHHNINDLGLPPGPLPSGTSPPNNTNVVSPGEGVTG